MANRDALVCSPLAEPAELPLRQSATVADFGPTLVIAPHPDDETLGCGGAIALLRHAQVPVHILVLSDGTGSHPHSRRYPAPALRALRQQETLEALASLGVEAGAATFMRLKDRAVPRLDQTGFEQAVARIQACLAATAFVPQTVLLPWRRDPHRDHRAAWELGRAMVAAAQWSPRLLEYPIWLWQLAQRQDAPRPGEMCAWRLDVSSVLPHKRAAIAAYRSQTTDLIDDDPGGFRLTPELVQQFAQPWEVYLEECP